MAGSVMWALVDGRAVAWSAFAPGVSVVSALMLVGAVARRRYPASRLGTCAVGLGLFFAISLAFTILVLALLPQPAPLVDRQLVYADAALGFEWDAFVLYTQRFPFVSDALRLLYGSAIPLIAIQIVLLTVPGREHVMQRLLLCGTISLAAAVAIWWWFPSIGPASLSSPSAHADIQAMLYHSPQAARVLRDMVIAGPDIAVPSQLLNGLVAFPSIHMVMALIIVWYSRGTAVSPAFSLLGGLMVPATLLRGGHHLVDLIGGAVLFVLAAMAAGTVVRTRGGEVARQAAPA